MTAIPRQDKSNKTDQPSTSDSSQGDSPVEMTPHDVSPDDATWKDRTPRNVHSDDEEEKTNAMLDEASDLSFPASDPIAVHSVTRVEKKPESGGQSKQENKSGK
jgi:hypothetical protein